MKISAAQLRAARAFLAWHRDQLAEASGVNKRTLAAWELEEHEPREATAARVREALERAGLRFTRRGGVEPGKPAGRDG